MNPHDLPEYPDPISYEDAIRECFYRLEDQREKGADHLPEIVNICANLISAIYGRSTSQVSEDLADCEMILGL